MRKEGKQEAQLMLRNLRDAIHPEGESTGNCLAAVPD